MAMAAEQVADSLPARLTAVVRAGDETFGDARSKPDLSMRHFHSLADRLKHFFFFLRCVLERDVSFRHISCTHGHFIWPFSEGNSFHMLPGPSILLDEV